MTTFYPGDVFKLLMSAFSKHEVEAVFKFGSVGWNGNISINLPSTQKLELAIASIHFDFKKMEIPGQETEAKKVKGIGDFTATRTKSM